METIHPFKQKQKPENTKQNTCLEKRLEVALIAFAKSHSGLSTKREVAKMSANEYCPYCGSKRIQQIDEEETRDDWPLLKCSDCGFLFTLEAKK